MDRKLSSKGMILDICSMRSHAKKLLNTNPEYSLILKLLIAKDYYNDESLSIPNLKIISEITGISYSKVNRLLKKLYADLCDYDVGLNIPFEINKIEILIGLKGFYNSLIFSIDNLPAIPRKGELMQVPFFKEYTGTDYYHVHDVHHELSDGKQQIYISLHAGAYSEYWQIRKDQAAETGEISFHDHTMKSDYELKKMLDLRPGKAW